jgi:glycosyltransferase involved in cell wall biosynthesis
VDSSGLPLVSIVTPSFDMEGYLPRTIESVLSPDYPNIEYIVVDGGTTDRTLEILKSYGDRLQYVSEPDQGPSDAAHKGFQRAHGEILSWLGADDIYLPGAVRTGDPDVNFYFDYDLWIRMAKQGIRVR